jgi:hypothetical protein
MLEGQALRLTGCLFYCNYSVIVSRLVRVAQQRCHFDRREKSCSQNRKISPLDWPSSTCTCGSGAGRTGWCRQDRCQSLENAPSK